MSSTSVVEVQCTCDFLHQQIIVNLGKIQMLYSALLIEVQGKWPNTIWIFSNWKHDINKCNLRSLRLSATNALVKRLVIWISVGPTVQLVRSCLFVIPSHWTNTESDTSRADKVQFSFRHHRLYSFFFSYSDSAVLFAFLNKHYLSQSKLSCLWFHNGS